MYIPFTLIDHLLISYNLEELPDAILSLREIKIMIFAIMIIKICDI